MKQKTFENIVTKERFVCSDARNVRMIDGVAYLSVQMATNGRTVLMRRDALRPVISPKVAKNA